MNKFWFVVLIFLMSCSSNETKNNFNFSNDMTFNEFKIKLDEYAINNPYPNIDE